MQKKIVLILALFLVLLTSFYFGFPRIENFTAGDETLWSYGRIPDFWNGIAQQKWKNTDINDKPGVTLAAISGIGLISSPDPKEYRKLQFEPKNPDQLRAINNIYFHLRLPIFLFFLIMLPVFFLLLQKLFSTYVALFSVIFIGLSPILMGISLIINPDSLLWIFMSLTLISFLIFLKEVRYRYAVLSGVLMALSLLTKYIANLFFPFFLLLILATYILDGHAQKNNRQFIKHSLYGYLIFILVSIMTIAALYPAIWVSPKILFDLTTLSQAFEPIWKIFATTLLLISLDVLLLKAWTIHHFCKIFDKYKIFIIQVTGTIALLLIFFVFINVYSGMHFYDFEKIISDAKPDGTFFNVFYKTFFTAFYPLIFGLTPIVAILFISGSALIAGARSKKVDSHLIHIFYFILFILIYYAANSFSRVAATVRYQIVIYPIASIIGAIVLVRIIHSASLEKFITRTRTWIVVGIVFASCVFSLASIRPLYFSYASILLPSSYILNTNDVASGGWEASQYLNSLPNAQNLVVWGDKKQVCEKFVGKCVASLHTKKIAGISFDYFISSSTGKSKTMSYAEVDGSQITIGNITFNPKKLYSSDSVSDYIFFIGNRQNNFVKIVSARNIQE